MTRQAIRSSWTALLLGLSILLVAAAPYRLESGIENARILGALKLNGELFHVQGLELAKDRIWVTSVDLDRHQGYLHEFDRKTGTFLRRLTLTDGPRYHPGGLSISGGSIWIPVSEMKPDSSADLVEVDAVSFTIRRTLHVADHIGFIAASGNNLVLGNWDARLLYLVDLSDGVRMRVMPNPSQTRYQDMKFVHGQLVASGYLNLWSGTIDWIDWPSMTLRRTLRSGAIGTVRPFGRGGPLTGEGMAIDGRELYVLPEDGPSRMLHFRLDERAHAAAIAAT